MEQNCHGSLPKPLMTSFLSCRSCRFATKNGSQKQHQFVVVVQSIDENNMVPFYPPLTISRSMKVGTTILLPVGSILLYFTHPGQSFPHKTAIMPSSSSSKTAPAVVDSVRDEKNLVKQESSDAKFWNRMADRYSKSPIKDQASYETKLAMTREYLDPASSRVLEFGCGTGGTALLHAPYAKHVHATDVSDKMIEIAKAKAKEQGITNVTFETVGIGQLDVPDASYDVVLGLSILHLLPQKDLVLRKVHQKLAPNGIFVSSTACLADMSPVVRWLLAPLGKFGLIPKLNIFTAAELKQSIADAGFTVEREFQPAPDKALFLIARKN